MDLEKRNCIAPRIRNVFLIAAILLAAFGVLCSGLLALFVLPAPNAENAVEVTGRLN